MATVTIQSEATRRAVEALIWVHASHQAPAGTLDDLLTDVGQAVIGRPDDDYDGSVAEIERAMETLVEVKARVAKLRETPLGDAVELAIPVEQMLKDLDVWVIPQVEEYGPDYRDGGFFAQAPEVRQALLDTRDAAVRLKTELQALEVMA